VIEKNLEAALLGTETIEKRKANMSQNTEDDDGEHDWKEGKPTHELVIRRDGDASAASTQQSSVGGEATSLNLAQGENWLRLVVSLDTNAALLDTQETTIAKPFPSISSLMETGTIDAPTSDCYICIDVDGAHVAIKDMRPPMLSQESSEEDMFEVCLLQRKTRSEKLAALVDSQASDKDEQYHALEPLERRQLKFLNPGDRIVARNTNGGDADGLVLEYVKRKGEPREKEEEDVEMTQESTSLEIVEEQQNTAASAGTEASKPGLATQPDGPTPKSAGEDEYKTAAEQATQQSQESDEESDNSFYSGEAEATQAFPRADTQSPKKDRESAYFTPANEAGRQRESTTGPARQDESGDFVLGTQPQEDEDEEPVEESDHSMDRSTQTLPKSTPNIERQERTNGDKGTSVMSPIAEGSEAQASSEVHGEYGNLDEPRPSQASTTCEDSKKDGDAGEETDSDVSKTQGEPAGEEEMDEGSNSDALVDSDEEGIKDASAGVSDKPEKQLGESKPDDKNGDDAEGAAKTDEKVDGHLLVAAEEEPQKSDAAAPVEDEQLSDSSSITELGEQPREKGNENGNATEVTAQKDVAVSGTGDDASHTSSITEADDMMSPRKGLVTVSRKEAPSDQARLQRSTDDKPSGDTDKAEILSAKDTGADGDETANEPNKDGKVSSQADKDDDETVGDDEPLGQAKAVTAAEDVDKVSGQADDDDETVGDEPSDKANVVTAAEDAGSGDVEAPTRPNQDARVDKVASQTEEDDGDETVGDETEADDATTEVCPGSEASAAPKEKEQNASTEPKDGSVAKSSGQKNRVPAQEPVVAEQVEDRNASLEETDADTPGVESRGEKAANDVEIATVQPNGENPSVDEESKETVAYEDKPKEPVVENGTEEAAVTEAKQADKETRSSQEASMGSEDHEAFSHSAETAVTDNRSPSVDRHDTPSGKEKVIEREVVVNANGDAEEAKGVDEAESSEAHSKPTADQADTIEASKSGASDEADTDTKKADEQGEKPAAKSSKKRKVPEMDASETAVPLRARSTRRKASPKREQEKELEKEEALKTPAKKRSTRRKAASTQPKEDEPENDDTHKTPAKKRARAPPVRGSARKRTRASAATPSSSGDEPVRVLITGMDETDKHKKVREHLSVCDVQLYIHSLTHCNFVSLYI
jgi:hypothetical protein